ncbi:MAG: hypothetical protein C0582_03520 [Alphaproteobacteria bacterium]|nr:MAG: hypothetical protein C0582_03520 [Alphaproteobacteria bacterium]
MEGEMRKPYTSFTIIGVLVSTFLITNPAHSRSSNQSTCSQALENLEVLDQKVRHETLLESIGLLLVMSKQTLRVRIEQLSQKELEMILPRIEAVSKRINTAQTKQETPPKIKNAITSELLARLKYISNRIKEVLRQYKTGERGGSTSKYGHAGTSQKARGKQPTPPTLAPKKTTETPANPQKKKTKPSCRQKADQACKELRGESYLTSAVIRTVKNPPSSSVKFQTYNFNPQFSRQAFYIHQDKSDDLKPGDIICVLNTKDVLNAPMALFRKTDKRC